MAVETVYRSTHKPEVLFMTRQEADLHDRMLEVAENLSTLFRHVLPSLSEDDAEKLAIFMSERRDELVPGLKKNPADILLLLQTQ
ncbi:YebG family protein [Pseudomonas tritici]|uniref:YebG family protein n=1 Tax=Pseudomonas tritici TaxID=2745518 RepID=UPI00387ABB7B